MDSKKCMIKRNWLVATRLFRSLTQCKRTANMANNDLNTACRTATVAEPQRAEGEEESCCQEADRRVRQTGIRKSGRASPTGRKP